MVTLQDAWYGVSPSSLVCNVLGLVAKKDFGNSYDMYCVDQLNCFFFFEIHALIVHVIIDISQ